MAVGQERTRQLQALEMMEPFTWSRLGQHSGNWMQQEVQLQGRQQFAAQEAALRLAQLQLGRVCKQLAWGQTLAGCGQQPRQHWQQLAFRRSQMALLVLQRMVS
jgi:hypothetical protein